MTEQKPEDEVEVYSGIQRQRTTDDESDWMRQSRWTALVLAATGAINTINSPLLRLPAELRIKIYAYALGHMYIFPNDLPQLSPGSSGSRKPRVLCDCGEARDQKIHFHRGCELKFMHHLGLLSTCRQVYSEAFPIFWSTNIFCFDVGVIMSRAFKYLLPHQKSLIRNIRIDINWFILDREWNEHLKLVDLASLPGLRQIQIITLTNLFSNRPLASMPHGAILQRRKSRLVKSVWRLIECQPSLTVVVIRNGRVYRRLGKNSRLGKLLRRL